MSQSINGSQMLGSNSSMNSTEGTAPKGISFADQMYFCRSNVIWWGISGAYAVAHHSVSHFVANLSNGHCDERFCCLCDCSINVSHSMIEFYVQRKVVGKLFQESGALFHIWFTVCMPKNTFFPKIWKIKISFFGKNIKLMQTDAQENCFQVKKINGQKFWELE